MLPLSPPGIISILDDECLRPGDASDASFLEKLTQNLDGHAHFKSHRKVDSRTQKLMGRDVSPFSIKLTSTDEEVDERRRHFLYYTYLVEDYKIFTGHL